LLNFVYLLLILFSLPWLLWQAVRKGKYREGYAAKFLGRVPTRTGDKPCLWLHAVSVGEVNLLAPLLLMIEQERPDWECVISTTTATGMALAKKKYPRQTVFYCPLDFSWAVSAAMRRIRPDVLVLAELELWPNLIRAARQSGARVAVINGRLSEHSFHGYRRIRPLVARLLRQLDVVAAQDETYAERFRLLGTWPERVCVTGSMKYDGAQTDRANPTTQRLAELARDREVSLYGFAQQQVSLSESEIKSAQAKGTQTAIGDALQADNVRVVVDQRNEKMNAKIREHAMQKVPFLLVVGDKEAEANSVNVRARGKEQTETVPFTEFQARLRKLIADKAATLG
jgi:3-deoxy-D-manno-octulosonic-acid transferase